MPIEITMPALSPTMTEGNIANWLKKEGDKVKPGDVIAEIETDKATMEVEAVDEGVMGKIVAVAGSKNVKVNSVIALLLTKGEDKASIAGYKIANESVSVSAALSVQDNISGKKAASSDRSFLSAVGNTVSASASIFASPLAKRVAKDSSLDISRIKGTGPHGRVIKQDVENTIKSGNMISSGDVAVRNSEEYYAIENDNMRRVIAQRLLQSKTEIPHFYLTIDLNVDKLLEVRKDINDNFTSHKISVNDLIIKAAALALRKVPKANASWTDEAIIMYNNVDISVAVAIDGGLITPIIRNADQKRIFAISNEMKELAARAKLGKLKPEEFQGGGFSISNLGMYGIKNFSAIINPPQSCIMAVGASQEQAVVVDGKVQVANIVSITLSCDHRVVDGAIGAEFLAAFKGYIEKPSLLLV